MRLVHVPIPAGATPEGHADLTGAGGEDISEWRVPGLTIRTMCELYLSWARLVDLELTQHLEGSTHCVLCFDREDGLQVGVTLFAGHAHAPATLRIAIRPD
jgi:hypothetical protein